jgi:hypothetical protein
MYPDRYLAAGVGGAIVYNIGNTPFFWIIGVVDYLPIVLAFVIGIGLAGAMRKR